MMLSNHDVICTLVNIALFRQKILVSPCIFYPILDIRSHIDVSLHEKSHSEHFETQNAFNYSIARFTNRSYVIHDINRSIESRFVRFCSLRIVHDLDTRMRIVEGASGITAGRARIYIAEEALELVALGELARKLQAGLVRILGRRHKRLL